MSKPTFYAEHDPELKQHGVVGMRWGIRKASTRGGTPPSDRKPISERKAARLERKAAKKAPAAQSSVKKMTDQELRDAIQRLQNEKTFKQLTAPEQKQSIIKDVLKNSSKQVAMNVLTQVGTAYISKATGVQLNKVLPEAYQVTGKKK